MGPYRTAGLILLALGAEPGFAQSPGWQFSPFPDEGDRATLGCARDSSPQNFTCLAVRCEDDFSTGLHIHSSRPGGDEGVWEMTLDREDKSFLAEKADGRYGARIRADAEFLLDRLRHGTFVYLRHSEDKDAPFAYIDLSGSMQAIDDALFWCAPRVPPEEQNPVSDVDPASAKSGAEP